MAAPPRTFDRIVWGVLLAVALGVLGLSRYLTPSPTGVGTHEQLGLPACGILAFTGFPCPACGMTTAFACLAHLDVFASLRANPMGLPLFLATFLFVPIGIQALVTGRSVLSFIDAIEADRLAAAFVVVTLLVWGARVAVQLIHTI